MSLKYVVEKIEKGAVIHIGVKDIQEAERVLLTIPEHNRGSVYFLYTIETLLLRDDELLE